MLTQKIRANWFTICELLVIALTLCLFAAAAHGQTTDRMGLDHGTLTPDSVVLHHQPRTFDGANTKPATQKVQLTGHQRWARRMWRVSEITTVASWQADAGTTQAFLHNGSGCTESAPGMGANPSAARLYGISGILYGVLIGLEEYVDRTNRDWSDGHIGMTFVNGFATFAHSFAALNNRPCL